MRRLLIVSVIVLFASLAALNIVGRFRTPTPTFRPSAPPLVQPAPAASPNTPTTAPTAGTTDTAATGGAAAPADESPRRAVIAKIHALDEPATTPEQRTRLLTEIVAAKDPTVIDHLLMYALEVHDEEQLTDACQALNAIDPTTARAAILRQSGAPADRVRVAFDRVTGTTETHIPIPAPPPASVPAAETTPAAPAPKTEY